MVVFFWFEEVEKVLKAKKRRAHGKTEGGEEMVELEKESSACESEGMLNTGKMYQVWFCYLFSTVIFLVLDLLFWLVRTDAITASQISGDESRQTEAKGSCTCKTGCTKTKIMAPVFTKYL